MSGAHDEARASAPLTARAVAVGVFAVLLAGCADGQGGTGGS